MKSRHGSHYDWLHKLTHNKRLETQQAINNTVATSVYVASQIHTNN